MVTYSVNLVFKVSVCSFSSCWISTQMDILTFYWLNLYGRSSYSTWSMHESMLTSMGLCTSAYWSTLVIQYYTSWGPILTQPLVLYNTTTWYHTLVVLNQHQHAYCVLIRYSIALLQPILVGYEYDCCTYTAILQTLDKKLYFIVNVVLWLLLILLVLLFP